MQTLKVFNLRKLWLSLLLLVGATAIAVPGIQEVMDGNVAKIGDAKFETLEAAFAAVQDGQTITLLKDCTGNGIFVGSGKYATGVTVDFGGFTYTVDGTTVGSTGTQTQAFHLEKDNKFTFKNGTITSENAKMLVQNYSDLTLEGMTLTLNNANYTSAYTLSNNNGNIVIDGTTINANPAGGFAFDVCRYSSYPSVNVTVTGNSKINGDVEVSASKSDAKDGFKLMLEAGTMTGNIVLDASAKTAMAAAPEKALVMKSETFTKDAPADYKWVAAEDGKQKLVPCEYVAQIGTKKYETLEAAWAEVQDGQTIKLLADCAGNGIKALQGKFTTGITVDFDGHTYTMDGAMVGSTGTQTQAFQLLMDNKITFKNGTIYSEKAKMLVQNYSDLTLEGMTLTLDNPNYAKAYTLSNNNGNVVIDGTTINANPAGSTAFDVCRYSNYTSVNVTVKGDSKINGDIEFDAGSGDPKDGANLTVEGGTITGNLRLTSGGSTALTDHSDKATVTKSDAVELAAPADFKWVSNSDGTSNLVPCEYVAQIGEGESAKKYESLEAAWAEVKDGETIKLLADCAGNGIKALQGKFTTGITVDFDGHTYTMDGAMVGSTGTQTQAFQLLMDNKITFKNGTIYSEKALMLVQNYSDLTLEGMTLTLNNANYASAYTLSNNNGNVVIDGTTINANPAGGFAFDVCRYSSYPSVNVTVTGNSKINGDVEVSASGSYAKDGFNLMFESATLNGEIVLDASAKTAMADTPEKAEVSKNNTLTDIAAPDGYDWKDNGDGTSSLALTEEMEMILIDGEPYPVKKTATYKKVTYRRTFEDFRKGNLQVWFVPFNYKITADDKNNFQFYKIHMIANSDEAGGTVTDHDYIYIYIEPLSTGYELKANVPYLVRPLNVLTNHDFVMENIVLYAPKTTSTKHLETSEHKYDFYGCYDEFTPSYLGEVYWGSASGLLSPGSPEYTLKSYRWYLKQTTNDFNIDAKPSFIFVESGDGELTGINGASVDSLDDIEGVYSPNGVKLDTPQKGMNVIRYKNGKTKKIIIK